MPPIGLQSADPNIAPSIIVGERFGLIPEVYIAGRETDPAVFMNDEHRLKVRQFLAICVGDFRPLHKSNVADKPGASRSSRL